MAKHSLGLWKAGLILAAVLTVTMWAGAASHEMNVYVTAVPPIQDTDKSLVVDPESLQQRKQWCKMRSECAKLAEAIVFEARGEPLLGQVAVAHVVVNRVKDGEWADSIRGVIVEPKQFSYLRDKHKQKRPSQQDWDSAYVTAHDVIRGRIASPVGDAVFYHNKKVKPKWAKRVKYVAHIGNHIFYKKEG